jgi:hypothetical protein
MTILQPDHAVEIPGVLIRSVGVGAQVDANPLNAPGADRALEDLESALNSYHALDGGVRPLTDAIRDADMAPVLEVPVNDLTTTGPTGPTRALDEAPALELTVEAPGEEEGQVFLEVDDSGVVAWHFPVVAAAGGAMRSGQEQVFRIPVLQADIPGDVPEPGDRALLGIGARKLLHLLRYPIQHAAGAAARKLVSLWEDQRRPYGLRLWDQHGLAGPPGSILTPAQFQELSGKPCLLLVHGTFSTAATGFAGLAADAALVTELLSRYEQRVLVFDHPSVSVSPKDNVRWLLEQVPNGVDLVLDVLAHSRGGLVGRALTLPPAEAPGIAPPQVRRVVHVATPNAGTALAAPERWGSLLDVVTNLTMLFPDTASVPLTAVMETVKQLGIGVAEGLDGLAAMDPDSEFLSTLTSSTAGKGSQAFTIASDFEPRTGPVPLRALDVLVDAFFTEGNDLVVPTAGVSDALGLDVAERVTVPATPAINHNAYFRDEGVRRQIAQWLPG